MHEELPFHWLLKGFFWEGSEEAKCDVAPSLIGGAQTQNDPWTRMIPVHNSWSVRMQILFVAPGHLQFWDTCCLWKAFINGECNINTGSESEKSGMVVPRGSFPCPLNRDCLIPCLDFNGHFGLWAIIHYSAFYNLTTHSCNWWTA